MADKVECNEGCGSRVVGAAHRMVGCAGCILASLAVLFGTAASGATAAECPNEATRARQGAQSLADCRAYELVSPPGSAPSAIYNTKAVAAQNGSRFGYLSWNPYPEQYSQAMYVLSTRGIAGWSTQSATPPQGGLRESENFACNPSIFYSAEMSVGVLADGFRSGEGVCEGDEPPLVAGEPRGVANLFLRDNQRGDYQLIDPSPAAGTVAENAYLVDGTRDLSHVVFSERAPLTGEAPGGGAADLYEWAAGTISLVSVLPGGAGVEGELANGPPGEADAASYTHALSSDGERVFFYVAGALYARLNAMNPATAHTVQVDAAEAGGESGGGVFVYASDDGSRVFFTDAHKLTIEATAAPGKPDLYEYDLQTGKLADLTIDKSEPADVMGGLGEAEDGSYLYFVADGKLPGTGANSQGATPVAGQPNLYVRHEGVNVFIATSPEREPINARVSSSGQFMAFNSTASLTGYDNQPSTPEACGGGACREIFLYDATAEKLVCVSCVPGGAQPTAPAELRPAEQSLIDYGPAMLSRNVLDDGRVFFDASSQLVPQARPGVQNVYEYQAGAVSLISTGNSPEDSEFLAASASGNDVFFATDEKLVAADTDNADSVYDARVDGGFEGNRPPVETQGCKGAEECKETPQESRVELLAGSVGVLAEGNPAGSRSDRKGEAEHRRSRRGCRTQQRRHHKRRACRRGGRR